MVTPERMPGLRSFPVSVGEGSAAAAPGVNGAQATVLYVEDDPTIVALVQAILARRPEVRLLTAHQATRGLELAQAHHPNLIILDIDLPGMNGYAALQWLQTHRETRTIPVIALTARAQPHEVKQGLAAGFQQYLTKPLNVTALLAAVDQFVPHGCFPRKLTARPANSLSQSCPSEGAVPPADSW